MGGMMKEFKNWWVKHAPYTDERSAEDGWRAALEWILSITDRTEGDYNQVDYYDRDLVKRELNGEYNE